MRGRHALFAASTGGHLEELLHLVPRFHPTFDSVRFVTFDDAQSRSLLAGQPLHLVPPIPPRGLKPAARALAPALQLIRRSGVTDVISTGAAIAVPFLLAARMLGVRAHYVESAARTAGPSLTGSLVSRIPGVHLYSQHETWATGAWHYSGSVFDHLSSTELERSTQRSAGRVVVTLGTMRGYPFDRAVRATEAVLAEVGAADREVLWQIGDATSPAHRRGDQVRALVPAEELNTAIADADLVIAHAGVGSTLRILESGHAPVLLYRQARHREHVDDHQLLIAADLQRRGLAVSRDPEMFTAADARWALEHTIEAASKASAFALATWRSRPQTARIRSATSTAAARA